jgi:hypothetical protein
MLRSSRSAGLALPVKFDGPGVLTRLVGSNRNPCPAWTERAIASFIAGLIPGLSGDGSGDRKSDAPLLATTSIHWLVCLQSTARVITTISGSIWEKVRCWVILFASVLTAKVSRPLPIAPACIVPDALRFEDAGGDMTKPLAPQDGCMFSGGSPDRPIKVADDFYIRARLSRKCHPGVVTWASKADPQRPNKS